MGKGAFPIGGSLHYWNLLNHGEKPLILSLTEREVLAKYCQCPYHKCNKWNPLKFLTNNSLCLHNERIQIESAEKLEKYKRVILETKTYMKQQNYKAFSLILLGYHKDPKCSLRCLDKNIIHHIISYL